jgi:hypothetical protein
MPYHVIGVWITAGYFQLLDTTALGNANGTALVELRTSRCETSMRLRVPTTQPRLPLAEPGCAHEAGFQREVQTLVTGVTPAEN